MDTDTKKGDNKVVLLTDDSLASETSTPKSKSSFVMSESPLEEAKTMMKIVCLIAMSILFELGPQIIASIMVGHFYDSESLDDEYLSAVGLTWTYVYITGIAITWGLTTGLFTLVPQALGNEDEEKANQALAIYTQRAFFVVTVACIPLLIFQFFAGRVMTAIGEPEKLEHMIQNYTYTLTPYIVGQAYFSILLRVNQAMELNVFVTVLTGIGCGASWPCMHVMMNYAGMEYLGSGVAQSVIMALMFIVLVVKMFREGFGFVFKPRSFQAVANWPAVKEYLALSMPGLIQNGFEFVVMQLAVILAGYVASNKVDSNGDTKRTIAIAACVIMYELFYIALAFGYGLGNAVNIRVGKYVGRGNLYFAKQTFRTGFVLSVIVCGVFVLILVCANEGLPLIFTHNPDVDELASKLCYALAFFCTFFLQSQFWGGIYRGLGYQKKSAIFVAIGYYLLCLPLLFVVLFALDWRRGLVLGTMTIWFGLAGGNFVAVVMCAIYFVCRVDWENALDESKTRLNRTLTEVSASAGSDSNLMNVTVDPIHDDGL